MLSQIKTAKTVFLLTLLMTIAGNEDGPSVSSESLLDRG